MTGGQIFGLIAGITIAIGVLGLLIWLVRKSTNVNTNAVIQELLTKLDDTIEQQKAAQAKADELENKRRNIEQTIELTRAKARVQEKQADANTDAQNVDELRRRGLLK